MIKVNNLLQIDEDLSSLLKFVYLRGSNTALGQVGFTARNIHTRRIRASIAGDAGIQFIPSTFELDPGQVRTVLLNVADVAFLETLPVGTTSVDFRISASEILPPVVLLPEPRVPGLPPAPAIVLGCLDPSATNYNPSANMSDGSCQYPPILPPSIRGCTDPNSINYNPYATLNDGSCIARSPIPDIPPPPVYGCMDPSALNYNPTATVNTGCQYKQRVRGCTNPRATNYNPNAEIEDGSCTLPGRWVLVETARPYSTSTTVITQKSPENRQEASADNNFVGGYYYTEYGYIETTTYGAQYTYQLEGDASVAGPRPTDPPREVNVIRGDITVIANRFIRGDDPVFEVCNRIGEVTQTRDIGNGYANICRLIQHEFTPGGCRESCVNEFVGVYGCTNPRARNYNPSATIDDNSCIVIEAPIYGCTDPSAINYNSSATVNDNSCTYQVRGCTDPAALNYNPSATINDGSCTYQRITTTVRGCTDPAATNYNPSATQNDGSCNYITPSIYGCMDPSAINYDPNATSNQGVICSYPTVGGGGGGGGGGGFIYTGINGDERTNAFGGGTVNEQFMI
jgi:hypothetical protein